MSPISAYKDRDMNESIDREGESVFIVDAVLQHFDDLVGTTQDREVPLNKAELREMLRDILHIHLKSGSIVDDNSDAVNELLAFPIDIDAVLQHLRQDMRDDWFTDAIQHNDLFSNKTDLRKVLYSLLLEGNGRYVGAERNVYDIPKKGLGVRYSLETDFYDRFIYQAICSYLMPYYDPLLSNRVLGHRYNKNRTSERYIFKNRIELWQTFEGVTKTALMNDQALLATDLINYYENISIDAIKAAFEGLLSDISASGPEKVLIRNAIQTLCDLLTRWGYSNRHGLPQNRDASSFIANVVLNAVDREMVRLGYDYYRYVDDIRIICENPRSARKALTVLISQLRTVGMNINSGKTKVLTADTPVAEVNEYFPTSDDRSLTIDNMWRSRSRRVISRSAKYIYQMLRECIDQKQTQSRQFRFAVNRLIKLVDARLFNVQEEVASELKGLLIDSLEDHPASTDQYCRLLEVLDLSETELNQICRHLCDHEKSIHSWQNFHLWLLLAKKRHKTGELLGLAGSRIESDVLQPEVAAIFIYLRCVEEMDTLQSLIPHFKSTWPYYHQRNFLLATSALDEEVLKPLVKELGPKLQRTIIRAKPYFMAGLPLVENEPAQVLDMYDEISPYD